MTADDGEHLYRKCRRDYLWKDDIWKGEEEEEDDDDEICSTTNEEHNLVRNRALSVDGQLGIPSRQRKLATKQTADLEDMRSMTKISKLSIQPPTPDPADPPPSTPTALPRGSRQQQCQQQYLSVSDNNNNSDRLIDVPSPPPTTASTVSSKQNPRIPVTRLNPIAKPFTSMQGLGLRNAPDSSDRGPNYSNGPGNYYHHYHHHHGYPYGCHIPANPMGLNEKASCFPVPESAPRGNPYPFINRIPPPVAVATQPSPSYYNYGYPLHPADRMRQAFFPGSGRAPAMPANAYPPPGPPAAPVPMTGGTKPPSPPLSGSDTSAAPLNASSSKAARGRGAAAAAPSRKRRGPGPGPGRWVDEDTFDRRKPDVPAEKLLIPCRHYSHQGTCMYRRTCIYPHKTLPTADLHKVGLVNQPAWILEAAAWTLDLFMFGSGDALEFLAETNPGLHSAMLYLLKGKGPYPDIAEILPPRPIMTRPAQPEGMWEWLQPEHERGPLPPDFYDKLDPTLPCAGVFGRAAVKGGRDVRDWLYGHPEREGGRRRNNGGGKQNKKGQQKAGWKPQRHGQPEPARWQQRNRYDEEFPAFE